MSARGAQCIEVFFEDFSTVQLSFPVASGNYQGVIHDTGSRRHAYALNLGDKIRGLRNPVLALHFGKKEHAHATLGFEILEGFAQIIDIAQCQLGSLDTTEQGSIYFEK